MECPVCLDSFTLPVVLPCGHTLCRDSCAHGLIRDDRLKCPTCRTDHWVPEGVENLPRNYALQEFLEQPGEGSTEDGPTESSPFCVDHADVNVSMLCVQCYQPVCVRCCLATPGGDPPKHFQHAVIPGQNASEYIQSVSVWITEYLQSRREEELSRFDSLSEATVSQQHLLKTGRSCIQKEKKRLKRLRDHRSQHLIGQLQTVVASSDLPNQSEAVLQRILEYDSLEDQCQALLQMEENDSEAKVWQKCEDFKRLLQRLDSLPSTNDQPISHQVLSAGNFVLNTDPLKFALTLDLEPPSPPQFSPEDCVFGDSSAAIAWLFSPEDHVTYFTIYYETAIYCNGMCNDRQSFDVADFGQSKAQTTIRGLQRHHRYRLYVIARNNAGPSQRSHLLYFKTGNGDSDVKII